MVGSLPVSPRAQTLVQLTDELVDQLDRRAAREGVSRSALIREILTGALDDPSYDRISAQIVEGYRRVPQVDEHDEWGDFSRWVEGNAARNRAALNEEEDVTW